tara:strand:- start:120 stop:548 length:429 start_codon:yes stop_codon:yes gene_type:complete
MSTLKADNLTGKTTAKTVTVTVGASVTQSLELGLIKGFITYDGTVTPSVRDSLNHSSFTDNANADHTANHTNNYDNATNYLALGTGGYTANGAAGGHIGFDRISSNGNESTPTTSARRISHQVGSTIDEQKYASIAFAGDLA